MAKVNLKNIRLKESKYSIEKRYEKLIGLKIEQFKDRTMGELWAELDILKRKMKEDYLRNGYWV